LRQAISLALFPDHEVQLAALLSDSNASVAKEFDLVIIDSAVFRATGESSGEHLRKLREWKVPTVWIDDIGGDRTAGHDKFVVLTSPIQKDTLQSAITECLAGPSSKENRTASMPRERMATKQARTAVASEAAGPQIIELVDVVAEPPERRKSNLHGRTK
jgi:hypothetical protein